MTLNHLKVANANANLHTQHSALDCVLTLLKNIWGNMYVQDHTSLKHKIKITSKIGGCL